MKAHSLRYIYLTVFIVSSYFVNAQYWFGPKGGVQMIGNGFQSSTYSPDSFKISLNYNVHVGGMFTYAADKRYAVHAELLYERVGRKVTEVEGVTDYTKSKSVNHFLSMPLLLRLNLGVQGSPVSFYVNGGPKLGLWMWGRGVIDLAEFTEQSVAPIRYRVVFNENKGNGDDRRVLLESNRIQYGFTFGAGSNMRLRDQMRMVIDARYSYGHSNMGFNGSPDFTWNAYFENFEYRNHLFAVSIGLQLEYNSQFARKGGSTMGGRRR
ncbi:MAG: PorT family protein [Cyclobacteriaceae bacterium]|nr:PorT family protein [Cyclobacteriaceae bacterium]